ncbi:MAG TPA: hypothetical protein VF134_00435, partial [Candidatus Dormibacteraeota bacterium]
MPLFGRKKGRKQGDPLAGLSLTQEQDLPDWVVRDTRTNPNIRRPEDAIVRPEVARARAEAEAARWSDEPPPWLSELPASMRRWSPEQQRARANIKAFVRQTPEQRSQARRGWLARLFPVSAAKVPAPLQAVAPPAPPPAAVAPPASAPVAPPAPAPVVPPPPPPVVEAPPPPP